ncbi:MAG: choline/ethanolamine kinase family protein [Gammaproteobacteria bacterium]
MAQGLESATGQRALMDLESRTGRKDFVALCGCLGLAEGDIRARPLSGGIYSRTVLVTSPKGEWAVRLPSDGLLGGIDSAKETDLLSAMADAGLSPSPLDNPPPGYVVTQYLSGARPLAEEDTRDPDTLQRIAKRLRELHSIPFELPRFRATAVARSYVDSLGEADLTGEQRAWCAECLELAASYDQRHSAVVLCHNDLVASNILDDGEIWFIDFEYAVLADPLLDLAGLAAMNGLSADRCRLLADSYYGNEDRPFDPQTFAETIRLLRLIAYLWASANSERNAAADAFVARMATMLR